jgi:hypothetical protein
LARGRLRAGFEGDAFEQIADHGEGDALGAFG